MRTKFNQENRGGLKLANIESIKFENNILKLIDQRKLPASLEYYECRNSDEAAFAIANMVVRGAPAIGSAAAYGVALAAIEYGNLEMDSFLNNLRLSSEKIRRARPTAVNLMWAVDRMLTVVEKHTESSPHVIIEVLINEAEKIQKEDVITNKTMAQHGNEIIIENAKILTHCNTGALATTGIGTALGVVREAHESGKNIFVYADETRPRLQGGRLTAWELMEEEIPSKLIADNAAATLIRDGEVDVILVGADRIAINGDTANKIGTFMLSVVAKTYDIPFYIVAPTTTIDFAIKSGEEIEIEERSADEIKFIRGVQVAPLDMDVYNPAFDVTPYKFITGIITEKGIIYPPFIENIPKLKGA